MLWLGTYRKNGGEGLHPLAADLKLGPPEPRIANASYAVWASQSATAYFVDEQEAGRVSAWGRADGRWSPRGSHHTGGSLPCYLCLSPDRRLMAAANYGDGSVALLDLDPVTGRILGLSDIVRSDGRGLDPERQEGPHAHCVVFDETGQALFHVDLGLDRVIRHRLTGGRFRSAEIAFAAPPASGPRHLVFHPDGQHALLVTELSAELFLLRRTEAGFERLDSIATSPELHEGNLGGHLAIGPGGTVLVTNRGQDSLAAFSFAAGRLEREGWVRTGAASPRHFVLGKGGVLVAHEEGQALSFVPFPGAGMRDEDPCRILPAPGAAFILAIPEEEGTDL